MPAAAEHCSAAGVSGQNSRAMLGMSESIESRCVTRAGSVGSEAPDEIRPRAHLGDPHRWQYGRRRSRLPVPLLGRQRYVFFDKERKTELKVTAEQERGCSTSTTGGKDLGAVLRAGPRLRSRRPRAGEERHVACPGDEGLRRPLPAVRRGPPARAGQADETDPLSTRQMGVFDHPEVREALDRRQGGSSASRGVWPAISETAAELKPLLEAKKITMEEYLRRHGR